MRQIAVAAAMGGLLFVPALANAQGPEFVPEEARVLAADDDRPDGWFHAFDASAGIQIAGSHQVPGQPNGASFTLSLQLTYIGELWRGNHELRLTGELSEAISRTPLVDEFVKSSDTLSAEAIYFYHLPSAPWFGPFARAAARTSLFAGVDVRPEEVTYVRDGEAIVADRLLLTNPLGPTYLKQSVGVFARPIDTTEIALDARLGIGAREVFADGNYVLADDPETPEIEVNAMQTYMQAGGEFALDMRGADSSGDITYGAYYEMLVPFYDSIDDDIDPIQATNYEIGANFGARLTSWSSVQYELAMLKVPQVIDDWQVTNMLLLSFNYGLRRGVGAEE